jgi:ferredoxin-NADP reductase/cytochrome b involved in lipid metabolism
LLQLGVFVSMLLAFSALVVWDEWSKDKVTTKALIKLDDSTSRRISMSQSSQSLTMHEVRANVRSGCRWVIMQGYIYDIGPFIKNHPGGAYLLERSVGSDVSQFFFGREAFDNSVRAHSHSLRAHELLRRMCVAALKQDLAMKTWADMPYLPDDAVTDRWTLVSRTVLPGESRRPVVKLIFHNPAAMDSIPALHWTASSFARYMVVKVSEDEVLRQQKRLEQLWKRNGDMPEKGYELAVPTKPVSGAKKFLRLGFSTNQTGTKKLGGAAAASSRPSGDGGDIASSGGFFGNSSRTSSKVAPFNVTDVSGVDTWRRRTTTQESVYEDDKNEAVRGSVTGQAPRAIANFMSPYQRSRTLEDAGETITPRPDRVDPLVGNRDPTGNADLRAKLKFSKSFGPGITNNSAIFNNSDDGNDGTRSRHGRNLGNYGGRNNDPRSLLNESEAIDVRAATSGNDIDSASMHFLERPYSVVRADNQPGMIMYIRRYPKGAMSSYIYNLREGDTVLMTGPKGLGMHLDDSQGGVLVAVYQGTCVVAAFDVLQHIQAAYEERQQRKSGKFLKKLPWSRDQVDASVGKYSSGAHRVPRPDENRRDRSSRRNEQRDRDMSATSRATSDYGTSNARGRSSGHSGDIRGGAYDEGPAAAGFNDTSKSSRAPSTGRNRTKPEDELDGLIRSPVTSITPTAMRSSRNHTYRRETNLRRDDNDTEQTKTGDSTPAPLRWDSAGYQTSSSAVASSKYRTYQPDPDAPVPRLLSVGGVTTTLARDEQKFERYMLEKKLSSNNASNLHLLTKPLKQGSEKNKNTKDTSNKRYLYEEDIRPTVTADEVVDVVGEDSETISPTSPVSAAKHESESTDGSSDSELFRSKNGERPALGALRIPSNNPDKDRNTTEQRPSQSDDKSRTGRDSYEERDHIRDSANQGGIKSGFVSPSGDEETDAMPKSAATKPKKRARFKLVLMAVFENEDAIIELPWLHHMDTICPDFELHINLKTVRRPERLVDVPRVYTGHLTPTRLERLLPPANLLTVSLCGTPNFVQTVRSQYLEMGLPKSLLSVVG